MQVKLCFDMKSVYDIIIFLFRKLTRISVLTYEYKRS